MSEAQPLEIAIEQWDREAVAEKVAKAEELRGSFNDHFPLDDWPSMPLERYALGQDQESEPYSWWLEWKTNPIGSIKGGAARKHLIWMGQNGWRYPKEYDSVEGAWDAVRSGFVEAFRLASEDRFDEITSIAAIPNASAVLCKSLYLYFPDRFVPVFSRDHINHFLKLLGSEGSDWATVEANRRLTELVDRMQVFDGMSHQEIMYFLYDWSHPNPSHSIYKIAPGPQASRWEECLDNGYICVGWDELGDLTNYSDTDEVKQAMLDHGFYDGNASTASKKAKELWTLVELRPGDEIIANRGTSEVLALGQVTEAGYSWDESRDEYKHTVGVDWDASKARSIEPIKKWATTTITRVSATEYHRIFEDQSKVSDPIPPAFFEIEEALERRGQVILYGPPGTGKTFTARRAAVWFLDGGSVGSHADEFEVRESALGGGLAVRQQTWFVVANPSEWDWGQLRKQGTVAYRLGRLKRNYPNLRAGDLVVGYESNPTKRVLALARVVSEYDEEGDPEEAFVLEHLADVSDGPTWDELKNHPVLQDSEPMRMRCQGTLFRLTTAEAQVLLSLIEERDASVSQHIKQRQRLLTRTTFHPSYTYEDFIEGYRPKEATAGGLELALVDGLFKDVCAAAAANPDSRHVVIIDEINRGNIPKVFGELITLLEKDKRGLTVRLPQSGDEFFVPPNVFLIGTMNTADRSIHLLDTALRRRFGFVEMMPDSDVVAGETIGPLALDVFLDQLNTRVRELAGRERQIGHAVLYNDGAVVQSPDEFGAIFRHEILPLLQEYLYEDYSQLAELLGETIIDVDLLRPGSVIGDGEALCAALASQFDASVEA